METKTFIALLVLAVEPWCGASTFTDYIPRTAAQRTDYSLRNLAFPWCNSHHRKSFLPSSVALWNALPLNVQSAVTLSSFRRLLSIHFSSDRFVFGLS